MIHALHALPKSCLPFHFFIKKFGLKLADDWVYSCNRRILNGVNKNGEAKIIFISAK